MEELQISLMSVGRNVKQLRRGIGTNLLGGNPLVLGETLVLDRLLNSSPNSESPVVLLSLG